MNGGETNIEDLVMLCRTHHRMIHQSGTNPGGKSECAAGARNSYRLDGSTPPECLADNSSPHKRAATHEPYPRVGSSAQRESSIPRNESPATLWGIVVRVSGLPPAPPVPSVPHPRPGWPRAAPGRPDAAIKPSACRNIRGRSAPEGRPGVVLVTARATMDG
ncbi:hypothetical protein [Pseudonocardia sp.]|uniref:hypothetical protein n=1 Tax=Pseudonocardia sp. TaxID=60912 RepID=UPI0039C9ACF2